MTDNWDHFLERDRQQRQQVASVIGCQPSDLTIANYGQELHLDGRVAAIRDKKTGNWIPTEVHV